MFVKLKRPRTDGHNLKSSSSIFWWGTDSLINWRLCGMMVSSIEVSSLDYWYTNISIRKMPLCRFYHSFYREILSGVLDALDLALFPLRHGDRAQIMVAEKTLAEFKRQKSAHGIKVFEIKRRGKRVSMRGPRHYSLGTPLKSTCFALSRYHGGSTRPYRVAFTPKAYYRSISANSGSFSFHAQTPFSLGDEPNVQSISRCQTHGRRGDIAAWFCSFCRAGGVESGIYLSTIMHTFPQTTRLQPRGISKASKMTWYFLLRPFIYVYFADLCGIIYHAAINRYNF